MTKFTDFKNGFDCNKPKTVEILISHDSKTLWLNIDGQLRVRILQIGELSITGNVGPITTHTPDQVVKKPRSSSRGSHDDHNPNNENPVY